MLERFLGHMSYIKEGSIMQTSMTIKELKRKGYKLSSQNGLALMFWRHGIAAKGERSIHEVYKLAQDGESLDSMISEWFDDNDNDNDRSA